MRIDRNGILFGLFYGMGLATICFIIRLQVASSSTLFEYAVSIGIVQQLLDVIIPFLLLHAGMLSYNRIDSDVFGAITTVAIGFILGGIFCAGIVFTTDSVIVTLKENPLDDDERAFFQDEGEDTSDELISLGEIIKMIVSPLFVWGGIPIMGWGAMHYTRSKSVGLSLGQQAGTTSSSIISGQRVNTFVDPSGKKEWYRDENGLSWSRPVGSSRWKRE